MAKNFQTGPKRINGNLSEGQLTLEKELELEGAVDRDLERGRRKVRKGPWEMSKDPIEVHQGGEVKLLKPQEFKKLVKEVFGEQDPGN